MTPLARILVVDDESYIRAVMSAMLEQSGFTTVAATDGGQAALLLKQQGPFDLVLSDIMMGGMDGLALLDHVQAHYPQLPIVMVTAVHDVAVATDAIRKGAYDYLLKPFEREQLLSTVNRALQYRQLTEQNAMYRSQLEELVAARTEMLNSAMAELERSYDITLEALGDALDLKDTETEGHSKRVTAYTIALARACGVSSKDIRVVARGAFLHDVGKMAIPDAILLKPGRLSQEEQATMREHCLRGYQMLRKIPFLREAAEIVYSHQEHFDGTGYPRRLKRNEIPLGARIFAVADTLDAITSDRPYRRARPFSAARKEIQRCSGTQFDPTVIEAFLDMPDQLWQELREEITGRPQRFAPGSLNGAPEESIAVAISSKKLNAIEIRHRLAAHSGWSVESGVLARTFVFEQFSDAARFVQEVAAAAEEQQHHPDVDLRYNRVRLCLFTHDAGGITEKDFASAATANEIAARVGERADD